MQTPRIDFEGSALSYCCYKKEIRDSKSQTVDPKPVQFFPVVPFRIRLHRHELCHRETTVLERLDCQTMF